jgi:hypothetical protein
VTPVCARQTLGTLCCFVTACHSLSARPAGLQGSPGDYFMVYALQMNLRMVWARCTARIGFTAARKIVTSLSSLYPRTRCHLVATLRTAQSASAQIGDMLDMSSDTVRPAKLSFAVKTLAARTLHVATRWGTQSGAQTESKHHFFACTCDISYICGPATVHACYVACDLWRNTATVTQVQLEWRHVPRRALGLPHPGICSNVCIIVVFSCVCASSLLSSLFDRQAHFELAP